ncbi:MAG: M48 family metallopeptidase [Clostridia bacterium]|nr:M48 family metallopeptidase [Clostridia bacterium]
MPRSQTACRRELITVGDWEVLITPNAASKRMILRPDSKYNIFRLTVPAGLPREDALRFLESQRDWMRETSAKRLLDWQPVAAPGERHCVLGRRVTLGQDGVPSGKAFWDWQYARTLEVLRPMLTAWQRRMQVQVSCVKWRLMKSRWGSCQPQKREIHLNTRLFCIPPECLEYILVHELCHLHHADHSPAFHAEMTALMPDWKDRKKRLEAFDLRPLPPLPEEDGAPDAASRH